MYWLQHDRRLEASQPPTEAASVPPGPSDDPSASDPGGTPLEPDEQLTARIAAFEARHPSLTGRKDAQHS